VPGVACGFHLFAKAFFVGKSVTLVRMLALARIAKVS
jgi:hypothetical protein